MMDGIQLFITSMAIWLRRINAILGLCQKNKMDYTQLKLEKFYKKKHMEEPRKKLKIEEEQMDMHNHIRQ